MSVSNTNELSFRFVNTNTLKADAKLLNALVTLSGEYPPDVELTLLSRLSEVFAIFKDHTLIGFAVIQHIPSIKMRQFTGCAILGKYWSCTMKDYCNTLLEKIIKVSSNELLKKYNSAILFVRKSSQCIKHFTNCGYTTNYPTTKATISETEFQRIYGHPNKDIVFYTETEADTQYISLVLPYQQLRNNIDGYEQIKQRLKTRSEREELKRQLYNDVMEDRVTNKEEFYFTYDYHVPTLKRYFNCYIKVRNAILHSMWDNREEMMPDFKNVCEKNKQVTHAIKHKSRKRKKIDSDDDDDDYKNNNKTKKRRLN